MGRLKYIHISSVLFASVANGKIDDSLPFLSVTYAWTSPVLTTAMHPT